jgi:hypothetical protein
MVVFTQINWRASRQIFSNNGCLAYYLRPEDSVEVSWRISFGSSTAFAIVVGNRHYQHWFSHRKRFTLASHLFSKEMAQWILFPFVWSVSFRSAHSVSVSQLSIVEVRQAVSTGTDKHRLWPVRLSIFCLCGRGYTPQQFIVTFNTGYPDRQVQRLFASVFGPPSSTGGR